MAGESDIGDGKNTVGDKLRRALLRFAQQKALGPLAVAQRHILAALG